MSKTKPQPYNAANMLLLSDSMFKNMWENKHKFTFFGDIKAIEDRARKLGLIK
jgi:hypothetical protein